MLGPDQWLEVGGMEIYDETLKYIDIGALDLKLVSWDQKEAIIRNANLDEEYMHLCTAVSKGEKMDESYTIREDMLACKKRINVPRAMRKKVMKSEHDSKIAGHFGQHRTMQLLSRNFFWPKMEDDFRQYCNKCDNCQRTKAQRHAKHGLLHPVELPCKPSTPILSDFITDLPESLGFTKILAVVDRFIKMAHFIPISKKVLPTVARA
jgi:hypothetical protein